MYKNFLWIMDRYGDYEWKLFSESNDVNLLEEQIKLVYLNGGEFRFLFKITGENYTIDDFKVE